MAHILKSNLPILKNQDNNDDKNESNTKIEWNILKQEAVCFAEMLSEFHYKWDSKINLYYSETKIITG